VVAAGPATRRLARELGIDLHAVNGSGRGGRVMEDDVKAYVRQLTSRGPTVIAPSVGAPAALPNFESFGPVERRDLSRIRKVTARLMSFAWATIPHVTQHDRADITELEAFRKSRDGTAPKLTVTAFVLRACAIALKQFPTFNASLDSGRSQLVLKRYYHIGVAVDTEGGLLVPVLRDVDRKSVGELAAELNDTAEKARQGKADMAGGTFTITNLGGIGGMAFTPIVNWPEVAILGLSRSRLEPVVHAGTVVPRVLLPLSLSYDHRVIDGAAAARFTRRIAELLESPLLMLL
jgi:pyruvate dehydrogenase E2 component (dihydrolipoamide acetyltransferase)